MPSENLRPPNMLLTLSETARAMSEQSALFGSWPYLVNSPQGDGHPVIVIPGFIGRDIYNWQLIYHLRLLGYHATGWKQGRNVGQGLLDKNVLIDRVNKLFSRNQRKVTLIGHSLGGVYAREIAREWPDEVRQVITLSSPFGHERHTASRLNKLYNFISPHSGQDDDEFWRESPPVPTTAIYSRSDGIVNWRATLQKYGHEQSENIEVYGSHNGMTWNPAVWHVIADRLAQAPYDWQPFKRRGWRRIPFPKPAWQPSVLQVEDE